MAHAITPVKHSWVTFQGIILKPVAGMRTGDMNKILGDPELMHFYGEQKSKGNKCIEPSLAKTMSNAIWWIENYLMKPRSWSTLSEKDKQKWKQKRIHNANKGVNPFLGMGAPGQIKPWGPQAAANEDYLPLDILREMAEENPTL